jgi:hypothetical protein
MFLLCHFKADMTLNNQYIYDKSLLNFDLIIILKITSILEGHERDILMTYTTKSRILFNFYIFKKRIIIYERANCFLLGKPLDVMKIY